MKRYQKLLLLTLIFAQMSSGTGYSLNECDEWVLSTDQKIELIQKELESARQNIDSSFVKKYSEILGKRYETRLLEACAKNGSCTRDQVTRTVREELEQIAKTLFKLERNFTRVRVYTTLASGMISSVLAYQYIDKNTEIKMNPALAAALGGLLGTVGITALYSLSAPLLENIQSKAAQMVYSRIGGTRNKIITDSGFLRRFTETFEGNYDRMEQKGIGRLTSYLKNVEGTFEKITMTAANPKLDREFIQENTANRLAYFLRTVRDFYQDIPPDQVHVMDTVYTFYGKYAKNPEDRRALYQKTIDILKQDDPNFDRSPELRDFYHRYLKVWLATSLD